MDSMTRREFAGCVVAGSAMTASVVAADASQKKADEKPKPDEPKPAPAPSPLELTLELVKQQYPHENLDGEALDEVRSDIRQHLSRSKVLSSQSLANADEPGFVFSAWRSDRVGG